MTGRAKKLAASTGSHSRICFFGAASAPPISRSDSRPILPPPFRENRGMPRGLLLLPAKRALLDGSFSRRTAARGRGCGICRRARAEGATRFCMGAAWRQVQEGEDFENVLKMVRRVARLGMEVCCSLGMLDDSQAGRLAEAGLTAYNHNLDTSPEFYGSIITTRNYDDRLRTLASVRKAGVTVCCGGIIGLGESEDDRIGLLHQLSTLDPHPESVPINALVRVAGTPLEKLESLDPPVFVRTIATARILMPSSMVRLSAGRKVAFARSGRAVFCGGSEFAVHRRKIADHSES